MIYNYSKLKRPKPIRKKFVFSRFSGYDEEKISNTLPADYSAHCYNFLCKNNKLTKGAEIAPLTAVDQNSGENFELKEMLFIDGEKKLFVTKTNKKTDNFATIVITHHGGLDILPLRKGADWIRLQTDKFYVEAVDFFFENKYVLLLSDGISGVDILDGLALTHCADSLSIADMRNHNERIFAVVNGERNNLWYSACFDPYDWSVSLETGGYINFDGSLGNIVAVKSLGDNLFVFCEYGIYRLSGYVDQTEFVLKRVYFSFDKIFAKSIVECGAYIVFAAHNGIYIFDGYNVRKKAVNINAMLSGAEKTFSSAYGDGKYFLSIDKDINNFDYGSVNGKDFNHSILLSLDMADTCVDINSGMNLTSLNSLFLPNKSYIVGLAEDNNNIVSLTYDKLALGQREAEWKVENIDFDEPNKEKIISSIEFSADGQYEFGIVADGKKRTFVVSPRTNKIAVNCKGKKFDFFIKDVWQANEISAPKIVVDFLKE